MLLGTLVVDSFNVIVKIRIIWYLTASFLMTFGAKSCRLLLWVLHSNLVQSVLLRKCLVTSIFVEGSFFGRVFGHSVGIWQEKNKMFLEAWVFSGVRFGVLHHCKSPLITTVVLYRSPEMFLFSFSFPSSPYLLFFIRPSFLFSCLRIKVQVKIWLHTMFIGIRLVAKQTARLPKNWKEDVWNSQCLPFK